MPDRFDGESPREDENQEGNWPLRNHKPVAQRCGFPVGAKP